jgi:biopolymer transport protein ExbD
MNPSPTPAPQASPTVSTKTKWRLGLLAAVVVVVLLPALFLLVKPMAKPQAMQVLETTKANAAPAGSPADALTILVGSGNHLYYYVGQATPAAGDSLHAITPSQPLRQVVKAWQQRSKSTIYIKPGTQGNYKALAGLLDEMNLAGQRSYAVVVPTAADNELLLSAERH